MFQNSKNFVRTIPILCFLIASSLLLAQNNTLPPMLQGIDLQQRLNEQVPLNLTFQDESGQEVKLRDFFQDKPVILTLVYYECPMLCTEVLNGLVRSLRPISFSAGKEFTIVTVSFDPGEKPELAQKKKVTYLKNYSRPGAEKGWHFLTGEQRAIDQLTKAVGFHYKYDPEQDQFAHAAGIMILTPEGKLARYFYGIEYSARDLRLALVEASNNRIGTVVDQVLLYCYHYDPSTAKYSAYAVNLVRLGGLATVLALGIFIVSMKRKEGKSQKQRRQSS
jgi:protein SCO1/2